MDKHIRDYTYIYLIVSEITFKIYCFFVCSKMLYNIIWILDYYLLLVAHVFALVNLYILVLFLPYHRMNELCLNVCRCAVCVCVWERNNDIWKVFYLFFCVVISVVVFVCTSTVHDGIIKRILCLFVNVS